MKECEEFVWGGCDGNANNFASKSKCEIRCKDEPPSEERQNASKGQSEDTSEGKEDSTNEICNLPEDGGRCRALLERYRFNPETNKCEIFQYGGCGGNKNNFEDIKDWDDVPFVCFRLIHFVFFQKNSKTGDNLDLDKRDSFIARAIAESRRYVKLFVSKS